MWCGVRGADVCVGATAASFAFWSSRIQPLPASVLRGGGGSVGDLRRGRRSGGVDLACWSSRPRARRSSRRRLLPRRRGALEVWWRSGVGGATAKDGCCCAAGRSGPHRPDLELGVLGACRRSMFFGASNPVRRGWWLMRLINASCLGVRPAPWIVAVAVFFAGGCAAELCIDGERLALALGVASSCFRFACTCICTPSKASKAVQCPALLPG